MRNWDAPVPMIVVVLFPYHVGAGFLAGRRGGLESAVTTGAVTALTGHVVVFVTTVLYTLVNGTWPGALTMAPSGKPVTDAGIFQNTQCAWSSVVLLRATSMCGNRA